MLFICQASKRLQLAHPALGAERDAEAVFAARIDAHGDALLAVDEHLDDALVDEDAQLERLVLSDGTPGPFPAAGSCTSGRIDERAYVDR